MDRNDQINRNEQNNIVKYFTEEIEKLNDYINYLKLDPKKNRNSYAFFYRIIKYFLPKINVKLSHDKKFYCDGMIYNADSLKEIIFYHIPFLFTLDKYDHIFPPEKWYILNIKDKHIFMIIRGQTREEALYLTKILEQIIKEAKKNNWEGLCKIFRSDEFY